jgi:hypothetical protein
MVPIRDWLPQHRASAMPRGPPRAEFAEIPRGSLPCGSPWGRKQRPDSSERPPPLETGRRSLAFVRVGSGTVCLFALDGPRAFQPPASPWSLRPNVGTLRETGCVGELQPSSLPSRARGQERTRGISSSRRALVTRGARRTRCFLWAAIEYCSPMGFDRSSSQIRVLTAGERLPRECSASPLPTRRKFGAAAVGPAFTRAKRYGLALTGRRTHVGEDGPQSSSRRGPHARGSATLASDFRQ